MAEPRTDDTTRHGRVRRPGRRAAAAIAGPAAGSARVVRLRGRLATVTPATLARVVLTTAVIGFVLWLAVASWPALLPFLVGRLIAYVIRPVVDVLDRVMPRLLAALIAVLAVVAVLVGIVVIIVPPLVTGVGALLGNLPAAGQIEDAVDALEAEIGPLSPEAHALLVAVGVSRHERRVQASSRASPMWTCRPSRTGSSERSRASPASSSGWSCCPPGSCRS